MFARILYATLVCLTLFVTTDRVKALDPMHDAVPDKTLDEWISDLGSNDRQTRYNAVVAINHFERVDPKALPALIKAIEDEDSGVRNESLKAISSMGKEAKSALPKLVEIMSRIKTHSAGPYAMAIGKIGGPETKVATRHLLTLQARKGIRELEFNASYLRDFTNRTVKQLIELLKDESAEVRERSAQVLGVLNGLPNRKSIVYLHDCDVTAQDLANALRPLLKDKGIGVRVHVGEAIARLTPKEADDAIPAIIEGIETNLIRAYHDSGNNTFRHGEAEVLLQGVIAEAMPLLIKGLDHEDDTVHYKFVTLIHHWRELAMPHLMLAIKNDNARIRAGAASVMSGYYYFLEANLRTEAIKTLVPALKDRDVEVRLRAAEGLLSLEAPQVKDTIPVFTACLSDDVPQRRERAASSLGRIGPTAAPAIPVLLKLLKDTTFQVRVEAAIAITKIEPHHASELLPVLKESILPNDSRISALQTKAIQAVQTMGESAALLGPTLISKLSEPTTRKNILLQLAAVKALAKVDEANAQIGVKKLIELLQNRRHIWRNHRILAIRTLVELGSIAKPALPSLLGLMNDESPQVATLAAVSSIKIDPMRSNKARAFLRRSLTVTKPFGDLDQEQQTLIRISVEALQGDDNRKIAVAYLPELIMLLEVHDYDANPPDRSQSLAISLLGSLGPAATSAIPVLKSILIKDVTLSVRVHAERAIQRITAEPTKTAEPTRKTE